MTDPDDLPGNGCIGIDPGADGSIAYVWAPGSAEAWQLKKLTLQETWDVVFALSRRAKAAALEKVSAMPKQGVSSTFKFGQSAGRLEAFLVASRVRFDFVLPRRWQQAMRCLSGGKKAVTRDAAQKLWPNIKVTNSTADGLLIAEWCRVHSEWAR